MTERERRNEEHERDERHGPDHKPATAAEEVEAEVLEAQRRVVPDEDAAGRDGESGDALTTNVEAQRDPGDRHR
ncbi:hypothetical protein KBZ10_21105 [Streptomyces sp. F63]|uniref:hypothetical protein n=1 Tax=Streptomyces sp. F63 TaxID=2824887 RepID=UPI001B367255|nr:hypothetical protein [Streptomyces sp. F63]MBQ0986965.1 hypothetical protein [Streptomyces sp. F63]